MSPIELSGLRAQLLNWFDTHQRDLPWRRTSDPYQIWVSEVMLQQTQVKTVIPYFKRFISRFPSVDALAAADLNDVLKLWEGLGYYSRARNLHKASGIVCRDHQAIVPSEYSLFRELPGVGNYIAAAVLSIAFDRSLAVVDGNVKRVLARLFELEQPVNLPKAHADFQYIADILLEKERPGDFNQAMMELGALVCKPAAPDCGACLLTSWCSSFKQGRVEQFPHRLKKKPVPVYRIATGVVLKGEKILITLRKPEGLLGGMWEFPGGKTEPGESTSQACVREIMEETNLVIEITQPLTVIKHAYTHFKIAMDVFICHYRSGRVRLRGPVDHRWITFEQIKKYPFPKANHKIFPLLEAYLREKDR